MTAGWGSLLGREPDSGEIAIEFDAGWDSPVQDLVRSLALVTTPDVGTLRADHDLDRCVYRWLAQSTSRCLFNTELSRCLALPYAPSAARLPFQRHLLSRQAGATRRLALTDAMEDALRRRLELLSVAGVVQPLPTFVAALLRTAADGEDLVAALADLRSRCSALRRHRVELQRALDDPATRLATVERISATLQADVRKLSDKTKTFGVTASVGTLYVSLAFASAVPMAILATIGLVRLGLDVVPVGERLHGRLTRPYEKVLVDLGQTTRNLGDAVPQLQRRWGRPGFGDWDDFATGLERVGRLGRG